MRVRCLYVVQKSQFIRVYRDECESEGSEGTPEDKLKGKLKNKPKNP